MNIARNLNFIAKEKGYTGLSNSSRILFPLQPPSKQQEVNKQRLQECKWELKVNL